MLLKDVAQKTVNVLNKKDQKSIKGGDDDSIIIEDLNMMQSLPTPFKISLLPGTHVNKL